MGIQVPGFFLMVNTFVFKVISYQENDVFIFKRIKRIVVKKEETSLQG